jgi:hypothetical protein
MKEVGPKKEVARTGSKMLSPSDLEAEVKEETWGSLSLGIKYNKITSFRTCKYVHCLIFLVDNIVS